MHHKFKTVFAVTVLTSLMAFSIGGCAVKTTSAEGNAAPELKLPSKSSYEEIVETIDNGSPAVVCVGRPSCQFCAVVADSLYGGYNSDVDIFYLSLEPYLSTPKYDEVKSYFGVEYLPSFLYYEDGEKRYTMNCPLSTSYYSVSGSERVSLYEEMETKIQAFLDGCNGLGEPVSEPLLEDDSAVVHSSTTKPEESN